MLISPQGTVKEVMFNGVAVKLAKSIFSFIPGMHLADVPIKHPEKKFEAGHKLKCRVRTYFPHNICNDVLCFPFFLKIL